MTDEVTERRAEDGERGQGLRVDLAQPGQTLSCRHGGPPCPGRCAGHPGEGLGQPGLGLCSDGCWLVGESRGQEASVAGYGKASEHADTKGSDRVPLS